MKKATSVLCLLLLLSAFLFGCNADTPESTAPVTTDIITFQGIPWNITPEELESNYLNGKKLTEETPDRKHWDRQLYSAKNIRVYGEKATVIFEFQSYTEGANGLYIIYVLFPEGTDAQAIREKLTADYGEPLLYEKGYEPIPDINDHAVWWEGTTPVDEFALRAFPTMTEVPATYAGRSCTRLQWVDDINNYLTIYHYYPDEWCSKYPHDAAIIYEGFYAQFLQWEEADN